MNSLEEYVTYFDSHIFFNISIYLNNLSEPIHPRQVSFLFLVILSSYCLLYTSDAADDWLVV